MLAVAKSDAEAPISSKRIGKGEKKGTGESPIPEHSLLWTKELFDLFERGIDEHSRV